MSDDPILAALARLEAGQAQLRADVTDRVDRLEAGLTKLRVDVMDRIDRLETTLTKLGVDVTDRVDRLEAGLTKLGVDVMDRIADVETRLMVRLNNSEERILNRLAAMEADTSNTKGFLLNDAAISTRRWLDLEARVTKLEAGK